MPPETAVGSRIDIVFARKVAVQNIGIGMKALEDGIVPVGRKIPVFLCVAPDPVVDGEILDQVVEKRRQCLCRMPIRDAGCSIRWLAAAGQRRYCRREKVSVPGLSYSFYQY